MIIYNCTVIRILKFRINLKIRFRNPTPVIIRKLILIRKEQTQLIRNS